MEHLFGFVTLGQIAARLPVLEVSCNRCDRRGRLHTDRLIAEHGPALPIPELRRTIFGLIRNPIIMSILLGFTWQATGIAVPGPIHHLCTVLGPAAAPLALFCLGASLPTIASDPTIIREATLATVLKLTVLPICVGWAAWFMGFSGLPWRVAVITAAMPTGANAFLLARRATSFAETAASTVVVTTAASVISIVGLLTWFQ